MITDRYDLVGVDDDSVDRYSAHLVEMNNIIASDLGCQDRVGFKSLVDLFDLKSSMATISSLSIPEIDHFLDTKVTDKAELCRRVLMAGCQSDKAALRQKIGSNDAAIVALYRGFSKFMLEDLDLHPSTQKLTRNQRKKLATKVSFEMIAVCIYLRITRYKKKI
jgi:pyoverdine/dityrosine biosynthesis protein Dit1